MPSVAGDPRLDRKVSLKRTLCTRFSSHYRRMDRNVLKRLGRTSRRLNQIATILDVEDLLTEWWADRLDRWIEEQLGVR